MDGPVQEHHVAQDDRHLCPLEIPHHQTLLQVHYPAERVRHVCVAGRQLVALQLLTAVLKCVRTAHRVEQNLVDVVNRL